MPISKTGKTLIEFNIKNGQFKTGSSGSLTSLAWLTKVGLEKNLATLPIRGDGEIQATAVSDNGLTGTLGMTARDEALEIANGIQKKIGNGQAEIQRQSILSNDIYFETEFIGADGIQKKKKTWLFGVEVSAPNATYDQTTDNVNPTTVEYAITVKGTYLKTSDGSANYVDSTTGQEVKVFKLSAIPTDSNYATFENSVPVPTASAT
jgi:hypothetical protein